MKTSTTKPPAVMSTLHILILTLTLLLHSHLSLGLPLQSSVNMLRSNLPNSPSHTLALSQPSSDLNPLIPIDPDAAQGQVQKRPMTAQEESSIKYLAAERGYSRQARLFESPNQQEWRRKREVRLFEYLA
ncbi:related to Pectin lyase B precursor [Sporisorium scitamineum]|uniref:Related to Pectin lyase B n=1 Tax=Sporisorium scitamineum TaxID=49012 RepID=A0A0F7SCH7_9BASI|nr:related to Pectin lyase B precursor [Sporisorium scitamineum]CDW98995.1 hypothetical protein [Sporisorium scitamineum]